MMSPRGNPVDVSSLGLGIRLSSSGEFHPGGDCRCVGFQVARKYLGYEACRFCGKLLAFISRSTIEGLREEDWQSDDQEEDDA